MTLHNGVWRIEVIDDRYVMSAVRIPAKRALSLPLETKLLEICCALLAFAHCEYFISIFSCFT